MLFIPYTESINKINLLYLLYLYGLAEYNKETKYKDIINYLSANKLTEKINKQYNTNISKSTINRLLNDIISGNYSAFLTIDKEKKQIFIKNHFRGKKKTQFVIVKDDLFNILITEKDDFLCKYAIYLYYICGKYQKTDSTAEQILCALGYSAQSGKNKQKLSKYNSILYENKIINITNYRDQQGRTRNLYAHF